MNKQLVIGWLSFAVVMVAIVAYATSLPTPAKAPAPIKAPLSLPPLTYSEHTDFYDIEAYYASSTLLTGSANTAAVELMRTFVADTIQQFKTDGNFDHLTPEDSRMLGFDQGRRASLRIVYLEGSGARTLSYIFTIDTDLLGAHGNIDFKTFSFDKVSGAPLELGDLFVAGSDYRGTLSSLARARLPKVIGEGYDLNAIQEGTMPLEENFSRFVFDNREFVLLFPPYQVAAYAAGPQTLRLPLSLLKDILKNEYR